MSYEICHLLLGFIDSSYDGGAGSQYEGGGALVVDDTIPTKSQERVL
jgi:uncharacterized cupin superfamily protein